jgi:Flp pilus assembly pilin Flp
LATRFNSRWCLSPKTSRPTDFRRKTIATGKTGFHQLLIASQKFNSNLFENMRSFTVSDNNTRQVGGEMIKGRLADFARCDSGATAMEYALLAALVANVIVSAVIATGRAVPNTFNADNL